MLQCLIVFCFVTLSCPPVSPVKILNSPSGCRLHPPHVPRSTWIGSSRHPHAQHRQEVSPPPRHLSKPIIKANANSKAQTNTNSKRYLPHLAAQKTITGKVHKEVGEHFRSLLGPWAGKALCTLQADTFGAFKLRQSIDGVRGPHSQLGDLHHGQAVRKAVFGRVFRLPERRSLSVTCLAKSLCPKALNTNCQFKKTCGHSPQYPIKVGTPS